MLLSSIFSIIQTKFLFQMDEHSTQPFRWGSCLISKSACLQMDGLQKLLPASKDSNKVRNPWNQFQGWKNSLQQQQDEFTATWHFNYATVFKRKVRGEVWTSAQGNIFWSSSWRTNKKKIRNARYRTYSKLSSSQCGLTSGPKWNIYWDMTEVS